MPREVTEWLEGLGLGEYAKMFVEQRIDQEVLAELNDADLKELGIPLGPRKKLLKAIRSLSPDTPEALDPVKADSPADTAESHSQLSAWERMLGERKPVTMLFADITDSTALTEKLDAEEAHELLYGATQRMCEAVEENRGTVCRFMGDGVMAMFGAPLASEQHAVDACGAALEMQQAIRDYARQMYTRHGSGLQIRVGLHSGEVVVLTVGEGDKVEYDASGPTVPIAARMEQAAEPTEVYLTDATRTLAGDAIVTEPLEAVLVKGISDPVPGFALRRIRSDEELTSYVARTTFVGRRTERNQLIGILDTCLAEGYGQTVHVRGEPGIGKTRLVSELRRIAESKGFACHRGLVLPFGVGKGQDAIRALVKGLLDIGAGADMEERSRAADKAVNQGMLASEQRVHLNDLLDLAQPIGLRTLYDAMDRATRDQGQQEVVSQLVTRSSNKRPVLIIVEDLHWADPITLSHLAALSNIVTEQSALLVMTSRIEGDPLNQVWRSNTGGSAFVSLELGPLRTRESPELIQEFMDSTDSLAQDCLQRAAGNPLFLEQLLRSARETAGESLPDSIQSLVVARLDRLEPQDKRALQTASVIGQRFELDVLNHLLETNGYDCQTLVEHNLLRAEGSSYLFTHALIQEGVYGSLLKSQRHVLHKRCADFFANSDLALCAEHLEQANDSEAAGVFFKAAREQSGQYRFERALRLTDRGLALARGGDVQHRLRCLKGELLHELDDAEASKEIFQRTLEEASDDLQRCDAWMGLAASMRVTDEFEKALELLEQAQPVAVHHHLTKQLAQLHHLRGNLYFTTGNIEGCHDEHRQALSYARQADSTEDEVRALGGIADAACAQGRMQSAYDAFRLCVERCREIGLGRVEVANSSQMANCFVYLAKAEEVINLSQEILGATSRVGNLRAEVNGLVGICSIAVDVGNAELIRVNADRGLSIARQIQSHAWEALLLGMSAMGYYVEGDMKRAQEAAEQAVTIGAPARAFVGGWTLGPLAVVTDSPNTRLKALREGDELSEKGMNGEGYLQFVRYAMLACQRAAMWDELDRYAQLLEDYTRAEPTLWSEFMVARGRALARFGRGERAESTIEELTELIAQAHSLGYHASVSDLKHVLSQR